ncbi:sulfate permease [Viridothelium virens]|uniref:Sulfate permease n=1 Tax=Viridothelium virens TaxID=1048519 RepID=A0A6A6H992_VIRVR|nr:sulfate permease [Viridothelium virens]
MKYLDKIKSEVKNDENLIHARQYTRQGIRALPSAAGQYVIDKAPIVQWLPRYNPRWLIDDIIAGITLGVLLVPQGLSYAKIANIPVQFGLMASWLPALIYTFMGTSKDLSTGPTSIVSLITAEVVQDLQKEGFAPQAIAAAVAFMIGIYAFGLGMLKLGFLLDFVSAPVLSGFISAAAITIAVGQLGNLLGEGSVSGNVPMVTAEIIAKLPKANIIAAAIGFSGLILLFLLQFAGKKWGSKSKVIWFLSIGRAAIALILFTSISFAVNKPRKDPLFSIVMFKSSGIVKPKLVNLELVKKVAGRSIAPLIAAALEHISIGKAFASKNGYVLDESQELTYLGVTNFFNSFFSALGVGGAMSRTAVNSQSGVKSPLSGILTSGIIILSLYKLSPVLFWIPNATLAAIIIAAVFPLIGPISLFYGFWKTSFIDFVASQLSFTFTLLVNTETGIGIAVAFNIAYVLLRNAFSKSSVLSEDDLARLYSWEAGVFAMPKDAKVFRFHSAIFFPNARRLTTRIMDTIRIWHSQDAPEDKRSSDRVWSVAGEKRIARLRQKAAISYDPPCIGQVVLDFSEVNYIDTTALLAFEELRAELRKFSGGQAQLKFVGLKDCVRSRFSRRGFQLVDIGADFFVTDDCVFVYDSISDALKISSRPSSMNKEADVSSMEV